MRRAFALACLVTAALYGCDTTKPPTDPGDDPGISEPDPMPDTVPTIAFGAIEGMAPYPDTTVIYSCGPGLFGGSVRTDSTGYYSIALRFPDTLRADLPEDERLGCMVQLPSPPLSAISINVPTITFARQENEAQPVRADIPSLTAYVRAVHTMRENILFDLSTGETKDISPLSPCRRCSYFGIPLHPEVVDVTPIHDGLGGSISISGQSLGTTTIVVYGANTYELNTPDGWTTKADTTLVGAIGVRVR